VQVEAWQMLKYNTQIHDVCSTLHWTFTSAYDQT